MKPLRNQWAFSKHLLKFLQSSCPTLLESSVTWLLVLTKVTHLPPRSDCTLCWLCKSVCKSNFTLPSFPSSTGKWSSCLGHKPTLRCWGAGGWQHSQHSPLLLGGFPIVSLSAWWSSPWWSYLKILFPLMWFQTKLLHKHWDKGFKLALAWESLAGF